MCTPDGMTGGTARRHHSKLRHGNGTVTIGQRDTVVPRGTLVECCMQQQRSRHVNKHEIGDSVKLHKGMLALLRQLGVGRRHLTGGAAGHSYHSGDLACA